MHVLMMYQFVYGGRMGMLVSIRAQFAQVTMHVPAVTCKFTRMLGAIKLLPAITWQIIHGRIRACHLLFHLQPGAA
jgi:hypothetical protein